MQQKRWRQQQRDFIAPENRPIEGVELAGEMEGVEHERSQAEKIEMHRQPGRTATQDDEDADRQIKQADQIRDQKAPPPAGGPRHPYPRHHDVARAQQRVWQRPAGSGSENRPLELLCAGDGLPGHADQQIPGPNSCPPARSRPAHLFRPQPLSRRHPKYVVARRLINALLAEAKRPESGQRHGQ
jgi:hypothetical protein